jgi:heat shock protein HslJ
MIRRIAALMGVLIVATALAACAPSSAADAAWSSNVTGKSWQWTASTTKAPASQAVVPDPANYTITFAADGTYNGKADCNQINGKYTVGTGTITIEPGASTMAACGDNSQDALFVAGLQGATTWSLLDGALVLANAAGDTFTFTAA